MKKNYSSKNRVASSKILFENKMTYLWHGWSQILAINGKRNLTLDAKFYGGVVEGPYMNHLPEPQKNGISPSGFKPLFAGLSGMCAWVQFSSIMNMLLQFERPHPIRRLTIFLSQDILNLPLLVTSRIRGKIIIKYCVMCVHTRRVSKFYV